MPATVRNDDFYLGDGLYAAYDGYQVRVYASDGVKVENAVYFDPCVLAVFLGWLQTRCPAQFAHIRVEREKRGPCCKEPAYCNGDCTCEICAPDLAIKDLKIRLEVAEAENTRLESEHERELARFGSIEEKSHLQTIDERDRAEEALSQAYFLVVGHSPEWSNLFGHDEALEEIDDAQKCLRAEIKNLEAQLSNPITLTETLTHSRTCSAGHDLEADCTCGLDYRIQLQTWAKVARIAAQAIRTPQADK